MNQPYGLFFFQEDDDDEIDHSDALVIGANG